ncbi:hypothetical protein HNP38_000087 [Chryseobacterium defluvii]|uniref:Baseplate J-like protein n=1 Tax=Chryseobacterium defluvii TaxID=160396 RepID=A0A840K8T2_9FLAO|nr:hypothetical protein [Chryseobacterium defluvii]MBB4804815.1 hypothetical protein [Chryseobacterium defluvii]
MENCSSKISIHQGMGTTQSNRFLPALETDYFLLEERKEVDHIVLAQKMSDYLRYFNEFNLEQGNWSLFFAWESTAVLAKIFTWNIQEYGKRYENGRKLIPLISDNEGQKEILKKIFEGLQKDFTRLAEKVTTLDNAINVKEFLTGSRITIENQFNALLLKINNENSIITLISSYQFNKSVQQLFGLLLHWKNTTEEPLRQQLENYPAHSPHYALFLAFLKLLGIAKNHLNEFTKRHLDFYYKEILQLLPEKANPDYVHLLIEPFAQAGTFLLPEKTIFPAGKNSLGKNKFYASTSDQVVNSIKIKSFLSHHTDNDVWRKTDLFPLNGTNTPFSAFPVSAENTRTGLLLASPLFYLRGGTRTITLKLDTQNLSPDVFEFWITGEKKWIEIGLKELTQDKSIQLTIPATEKAIVPFDQKIHDGDIINTSHPILKIIPKNNTSAVKCSSLSVKINVTGLKNFMVSTDTGVVDINKPFKPFGDFPKNGNGFTIGCNEFFVKKGAVAQFSIDTNVSTFHSNVNQQISALNDNLSVAKTTAKAQLLEMEEMTASINHIVSQELTILSGTFISAVDASTLFEMKDGHFTKAADNFSSTYTNSYPVKEYLEDVIPDKKSISGYIRIQLDDPAYEKEKFLQDYIAAAKTASPVLPTVPVIQSIMMNYSVAHTYTFKDSDNALNPIEYYHLLPFGHQKFTPKSSLSLIPSLPQQGEIYIGLENAQAGNGLSILFQMAEGTANPRKEPAKISWKYLSNNEWKTIDSHDIGDETLGLLQSGIVKLTLPEFDNSQTTVLPASLFWIKISVEGLDRICHFVGIHEQALKAVLFDFENNGSYFLEMTPQGTVSKLYQPHPSVKKVKQPYSSFGGKKQEDDSLLYQRSSERLRHKQRAITSWDHERIILQEFPEVYRIKCLNHYRYDTGNVSNVSAGYVTLIPIARSLSSSAVWEWKPLLSLSTLQRIRNRVTELCSPHVRLCVKPPVLEKIQIRCKVKYREIPGADTRLYADILKETLNKFISPWAYSGLDIDFAKKIELSALIQLIDNQSFVDYVVDFQVNQLILDDTENIVKRTISDVKEIVPQTDYTLFIPNDVHEIEELKNNC